MLLTKPRRRENTVGFKVSGPTWMKTKSRRIFNRKFEHCLRRTLRPTCKLWYFRRHCQRELARRTLSLQIRQLHRRELRLWRSRQLAIFLGYVSCRKTLRENLLRPSGGRCVKPPPADESASMLETLFVGPPALSSNLPSVLDPHQVG